MKKILLTSLFLGFLCFITKAQNSTNEMPYSWARGIDEAVKQSTPTVTMPRLDMEAIKKEDLENEGIPAPVRFGFTH